MSVCLLEILLCGFDTYLINPFFCECVCFSQFIIVCIYLLCIFILNVYIYYANILNVYIFNIYSFISAGNFTLHFLPEEVWRTLSNRHRQSQRRG